MVSAIFLSGCGGSSKPPSVAVTAAASTVDGLNTVALTATVTNDKNSDGVTWSVSGSGTLSNTTTTSATYTAPAVPASALTVTVTATSVADTSKTGIATLTVPGKLTVTSTGGATGTLAGAVGTVYSVQLESSAGISPYKWSLAAGSTLPACLSMNSAGLITSNGPLLASCAVDPNITFDVSDSGNPPMTASEQLDLVINPAPAIVFSTTTVPPATATFGVAYTGAVSASGGAGALSYSATGLPTGLSLNATTGAITGTPTAAGTFSLTVTASDAYGDASKPQAYPIVVSYPAVTVTPASGSLPIGFTGTAYPAQTLTASGGSGKGFTWTVTGLSPLGVTGLSPTSLGYTANGATLTFSGTPTTAQTVSFTAKATDGAGNVSSVYSYSITIYNPLALPANPSTLPSVATVNVAYSGTLTATGGSGNYSYVVTGLSDGLASSTTAGVLTISGTPTATATVTFSVTVTDTTTKLTAGPTSYTVTASNALTLPTTNPSTLPSFATVGVSYSGTIVAAGGSGNYSWTVTGLSNGLTSSSSGGTLTISGTPTATGALTFNVTLTDTTTGKSVGPIQYTITAYNALALPANPSTLPSVATVNVAYSGTITATGGSGNYSYAVTGLSDGLASSTTAGVLTISGTPTATATVTFSVTVTDTTTKLTAGPTSYPVTVSNALTLPATNPSTLPSFATVGVSYSGTIVAAGGSGNYSWTVTGLSNGLTSLSSGGTLTISGKPTATGALTFNVTLTDTTTGKSAGPIQYTITAYNQLAVTAMTLPVGYPGTAYPATSFAATGGSGTYSKWIWAATNGTALPSGLSLGQTTGAISGTPANAGTTSVVSDLTVTVTDSAGNTASANFTLTIDAKLALPASGALAGATTNQSYSGSIVATGGSGSGYVFTVNVGSTPTQVPTTGATVLVADGITVSNNGSSTLTIGGTPTQAQSVTLTVSVKDGASHTAGANAYTIAVTPPAPLALPAAGSLPGATTNVAYNGSIVATGGSGSGYVFTVNSSAVPTTGAAVTIADGITVSSTGGKTLTIGGTPTLTQEVSLSVSVKDGAGDTAGPNSYSIAVNPPSPLTLQAGGSLSGATTNVSYTAAVNASGGSGSNYAFTVDVGTTATAVPTNGTEVTIADGIWVSNTGGNTLSIGGTPTTAETVTLTVVTVKDGAGDTAGPNSYSIAVNPPSPLTLPAGGSLPSATTNVSYSAAVNASGGSGSNYAFTVDVGTTATAVPTNGTEVTIADGVWVSNTGGNTLTIGGTPTTAETVTLTVVKVKDGAGDTAGPNSYSIAVNPPSPLTLPAASSNPLPAGVAGVTYSGAINASGGAGGGNYYFTVNGTTIPTNMSYVTATNSDGLTFANSGGNTLWVSGKPASAETVTLTIEVFDTTNSSDTATVAYTVVISNEAAVSLPAASTNPLGAALVGVPYGASINASGGPGGGNYQWTVNGVTLTDNMPYVYTSVSDGDGLTVATSGGNTLWFGGTPTLVNSGISIVVTVTDTTNSSDTATATYTVPVVTGPSGANNKYLSGTYVCKFDGFNDSDGSRWTSVISFKANGAAGTITGGIWDTNGRDFTSEMSGTATGTYNIGTDNNGLMTIDSIQTSGGSGTHSGQYAIALNNTAGPTTATEFRMVEIDDVGSSPSGMTGTGDCYQATTSVFGTDVFTGNSFVFGLDGDNGNGDPTALLGRFYNASGTAAGSLTGGIVDQGKIGDSSVTTTTLTGGSYTTPDATNGRSTLTFTTSGESSVSFEVYVIDANRMFMIQTTDQKASSGDVRKQLSGSNTASNPPSGNVVFYTQAYEYTNGGVSGYDSEIMQGTFNGSGSMTINQSYADENGTYKVGNDTGTGSSGTWDPSNPGRVTSTSSTDLSFMYFYSANSAFFLDLGTCCGGGIGSFLEWGWMEPQSETTFNYAAVAGTYLFGQMPRTESGSNGNAGELILSSCTSGSASCGFTGGVTTGGEGDFSYDQSIGSMTYNWDTTVTGTGSYLVGTGSKGLSCMVISATKDVCIFNGDDSPSVAILQQ